MKDTRLAALKVGLVCAAVLFVLYVMMSLLINNSLYDYYNRPHEWISDDVGFFWLLAYFGIANVIILATGPVSTLAAYAGIRTNKDALAVPVIACTAEVILSIAAVMIYGAALSAGNLLPYFRDIYTYQIAPMSFLCMPVFIWSGIISVFFGYLLYAARRTVAGKSPGK